MFKTGKLVVFSSLFFVVLPYSDALGLDTSNMTQLQKNVRAAQGRVSANDKVIVADFIAEGLQEILLAEDTAEMAEIRSQLALFAESSRQPSEYSFAYVKAMNTEISKTLNASRRLKNPDIKTTVELNLMVLLAQLKSSELAHHALPFISHSNAAVKYWAVKAVANKSVAKQLNSDITGDEELKEKIISSLLSLMTKETPAVISDTIVDFAANLKSLQSKDLLGKICILRTQAYADWTVTYEVMDAGLLNAIAEKIAAMEDNEKERANLSRMFAQLYSYVIQRFMLGGKTLDNNTKRNLIGVMLDVEEKGLSKIMGSRKIDIKQAVTALKRDPGILHRKYDAIFGSVKKPGTLQNKLKFNYGSSPNGRPLSYPIKLKAPIIPD